MVDAVVYISSHEQAEVVIAAAKEFGVFLQPFGGGTNVTESLYLNGKYAGSMIVAIDLSKMSKIKWIDKKNMMICAEAGIRG